MRVAIMGAGLSGLSCAITLEKHGIKPAIFEKRSRVGDRFVNGEALFNVLNRPINNCLTYIADKYEIFLEPTSEINKITFHSKNEVGTIEGNLGALNIRGRHKKSFENQLAHQVRSKIIFNSEYTYEELKNEYDYVVLATGDGAYASQLNNYKSDITVSLCGATAEGRFIPSHTSVWFNYDFVPKGYAYVMPFSEKEANIVVAYPDYPENRERDINVMWSKFYDQVCEDTGQEFRVTDRFQISRYIIGICDSPKMDNTYFVGNCFGAIGPALGFGQFAAILTGIYAALDIVGIGKYEELVKPLFGNYRRSLVIRRALEQLNSEQFDFIIKNLDNKLLDNTIDKLFGEGTEFDFIKWASTLMKPWVKLKQKK